MPNDLYNQLYGGSNNTLISKLAEFKKNFTGDPKQVIQNMLNSGRITQDELNRLAQQANEIYKMLK